MFEKELNDVATAFAVLLKAVVDNAGQAPAAPAAAPVAPPAVTAAPVLPPAAPTGTTVHSAVHNGPAVDTGAEILPTTMDQARDYLMPIIQSRTEAMEAVRTVLVDKFKCPELSQLDPANIPAFIQQVNAAVKALDEPAYMPF